MYKLVLDKDYLVDKLGVGVDANKIVISQVKNDLNEIEILILADDDANIGVKADNQSNIRRVKLPK